MVVARAGSLLQPLGMLWIVTVLVILAYAFYPFLLLLLRQQLSPLRHLPGPSPPSKWMGWFMGNLPAMHDAENTGIVHQWIQDYGGAFVYRGFVGGRRLMLSDERGVGYVLSNAYAYPKPSFVRDSLASMVGYNGLLTSDGDTHRRQRRILTPAFTSTHLKSLEPIFWDKARQLTDVWSHLASLTDWTDMDILPHLTRATLDVIGLAGFNYHFNALPDLDSVSLPSPTFSSFPSPPSTPNPANILNHQAGEVSSDENENELSRAFSIIFGTARKFRVITILQVWFPLLRRLKPLYNWKEEREKRNAVRLVHQVGRGLISTASKECEDGKRRDLLSVLVRANQAQEPTKRMSEEELLSQISTFLAAGHETTASALCWTLYALATHPEEQTKLRNELLELAKGDDSDLGEAVASSQYLDAVVRETLRVHAPVTNTMRVCMQDGGDEVPMLDGSSIRLNKYDIINIPIGAINKASETEWRPEHTPSQQTKLPGLYANTLTFLNSNGSVERGNRACIGWKFALGEIKIFLFALLIELEFSIRQEVRVEKRVNVVTRPFVDNRCEMPLRVRRYVKA